MKKSIIALAVSTALVVPLTGQADTILYGSARVSVDYVDEGGNSLNDLFDSDGFLDVTDNSSRLGVLGSEELGGGLSAIYQYEFGVDITEGGNLTSNRPKFVGLKGGFGQISVGTQETPYYHIVGIADTFNSGRTFGPGAWLGGAFALDAVGELSNGDVFLFVVGQVNHFGNRFKSAHDLPLDVEDADLHRAGRDVGKVGVGGDG